MTRVALFSSDVDMTGLAEAIHQAAPELELFVQGQGGADSAEIAVCWNAPHGALARLPNLRLIHSIAAGVDHIFSDPLAPSVPVCRVVDPGLKRGMAEYVIWGVLNYHRWFDLTHSQQRINHWFTPMQTPAALRKVGVMGLGELGGYVATQLAGLGFDVRGWARSPKTLVGVSTWAGPSGFHGFLDRLDCLICLMPLTSETQSILNTSTFARLSHGSVLINCGRGGHLVVDDLLAALESGQLRGALLDVFDEEPLAQSSALWQTKGITITPHMASSASNDVIASQVIENIERLIGGKPLKNRVVGVQGY